MLVFTEERGETGSCLSNVFTLIQHQWSLEKPALCFCMTANENPNNRLVVHILLGAQNV